MRILVTGTRSGAKQEFVDETLARVAGDSWPVTLIHGDARGIDTQAGIVARTRGWTIEVYPADWNSYGKRAGSLRNQQMVDTGADVCVAFPGPDSIGTHDCIRRAKRAHIPVLVFDVPAMESTR